MRSLSILSLNLIRVTRATGAKTFLIKVFINLWKRLLFGRTLGVGVVIDTRPGAKALKLKVKGQMASFPQYIIDIVEK